MNENWLNKIHQGDALEILRQMPDDFVDCVITSPPYWLLRFYLPKDHPEKHKEIGMETTYQEHIAKILEVTLEIKRVLKPSGSFWLNYGDSWASNGSIQTRFYHGKNPGKHKISKDAFSGRARTSEFKAKCMTGMPWRIALAMCDDDRDDVYELRKDLTQEQRIAILQEISKYGQDKANIPE